MTWVTDYKKEKRNINALLQNNRELSTTVEKKRKKDVIKGSAKDREKVFLLQTKVKL